MEVVNPFILKNKIRIIKYLDDLSLIHETTPPPAHWSVTDGQQLFSEEPVRELAHVHSIYELHAQELQDMANQTGKVTQNDLPTTTTSSPLGLSAQTQCGGGDVELEEAKVDE